MRTIMKMGVVEVVGRIIKMPASVLSLPPKNTPLSPAEAALNHFLPPSLSVSLFCVCVHVPICVSLRLPPSAPLPLDT